MAVAEVNGAQIAYDDSGEAAGPPILLAHGFLMDRSMFSGQVEALSATHRVICWDERGFGDTVYDGEPFTYWDSAADGLALLDHLGIDEAVVGGMSQGGFVSLRMALLAPERVRALVLLDTQAGTEDPEVIPLYEAMIDDWVTNGPSNELAATVASIIITDEDASVPWIAKWQTRPKEGLRQPGTTLLTRDSVGDRLGEITAPAFVVHGTADAAISMAHAEHLASGLAGSGDVVAIDGAGHSANMTHPAEVNAALVPFLAAL
jgi:pimeloyl-ACP methyl ester carboxylesterase